MNEHPILFTAQMVRAILEGRKTQTRRIVKFPLRDRDFGCELSGNEIGEKEAHRLCPYGRLGGMLWVRESFQPLFADGIKDHYQADYKTGKGYKVYYMATDARQEFVNADGDLSDAITPSIFMPRWASRITLEVIGVRVERLQGISETDAIAEGLRSTAGDGTGRGVGYKWTGVGYEGGKRGFFHTPHPDEHRCACKLAGPTPAQCAYHDLWDHINGKKAPWASNPWVWALKFKRAT